MKLPTFVINLKRRRDSCLPNQKDYIKEEKQNDGAVDFIAFLQKFFKLHF